MHILRSLLILGGCCLASPPPPAAPLPCFVGAPLATTPIAGSFTIRVGMAAVRGRPAPGPRPRRVAVYLDGALLLNEETPLAYIWDTRTVANGPHTLLLRALDPAAGGERAIEKLSLLVDNARGPAAPGGDTGANVRQSGLSPAALSPRSGLAAAVPHRQKGLSAVVLSRGSGYSTDAPGQERGVEMRGAGRSRSLSPALPVLAMLHPQRTPLMPTPNSHPLAARATALRLNGDRLAIGLGNGSLILFDCKTRIGKTLRLPQPAGRVVAIEGDGRRIVWLAEPATLPALDPNDPVRDSAPSGLRQLCVYTLSEGTLAVFSLGESNVLGSAQRIALWQGDIALMCTDANGLLDPDTGEVVNLEPQLPAEAASSSPFSTLYLVSEGEDGLAVREDTHLDEGHAAHGDISRLRLSLWRLHRGEWGSAGVFLSDATDTWRPVPLAVTAEGVCSVENRTGFHVTLSEGQGRGRSLPLPFRSYFQPKGAQVTMSGSHLWTTDGAALYHTALDSERTDAFLPWNDKGLRFRAFAADPDGVWLATNRDVRHLDLRRTDPRLGYAGLVKFRLGPESATPVAPRDRKLARLVDEWQGVPYLWGGSTKKGADCSGFVMAVHAQLGVSLPRGTAALRNCAKGALIRDELRYGDVLVYPGHCAIYLGDGKTAETVDRAVSYASVWYHEEAVVRRFLHAPTNAPRATKSTSGPAKRRGK